MCIDLLRNHIESQHNMKREKATIQIDDTDKSPFDISLESDVEMNSKKSPKRNSFSNTSEGIKVIKFNRMSTLDYRIGSTRIDISQDDISEPFEQDKQPRRPIT